jgi:AbrB family looped-hinge helix DNA binding protein
MTTTLNEQGQITIPEHVRAALGWEPGSKLVLDANEKGELVLRQERIATETDPDRFEKAIGTAEIKWPGTTDEYMALIRGED